jgi:hypothetical protein
MKNLHKLVILALLLISSNYYAQKNVVKLGLFGLPQKNLKLQYERVLTQRLAVQVSGSFLLNRGLPSNFTNELVKSDDQNTGFQNYITSTFLKGVSIIPELRVYSKKKDGAPRGFYFGPYFRYANFSMGYAGVFDNTTQSTTGTLRSFGGGLSLGVHWLISDRVSIDWNFLSFGVNSNQFKLEFTRAGGYYYGSQEELAELENEISRSFKDLPLLGNNLKVEITNNSAAIISNFLFPAIRSGLTIGIAF